MEHLLEQLTILGSFFCHQEPGRTVFCLGTPSALCARCTGMYSAFLWGVVVHLALKRGAAISKPALGVGILLVALGGLDVFWVQTGNLHRVLAGGVLGLGLALVALPLAGDFFIPRKAKSKTLAHTGRYILVLWLWLGVIWLGHMAATRWFEALFTLSLLGVVGLITMIGTLNAVILGNLIPWRPRGRGMAILVLLFLVGAEIAALMLWGTPRSQG